MRRSLLIIMSLFVVLGCFAVNENIDKTVQNNAYKEFIQKLKPMEKLTPASLFSGKSLRRAVAEKENNVDDEFIFNPEGVDQNYVMSLYSYDQTNSKFVHAQSLYSLMRVADDGKTVYFRHLTKSLGTITWLKGERRVMEKDSLEVGIKKGDTIIDIPYGQPLAYYKNQYIVFFCPMDYNDNTGEMEAQDNYTLIVRDGKLIQPTYAEGHFQGAAGYVVVNEKTQGTLSLDIDHEMRLESKPMVKAPEDVEAVDYVYSFINSYGNVYKKKSKVKKQGDDLYMQLSTSAPDAYVKGTIKNGEIEMESGQVITDSTFVYYYSLADPVFANGEIDDFVPTTVNRLGYDEATRTIAPLKNDGLMGGVNTISVDYLDGMEKCMDYVMNPVLTVYPGDVASTPINPTIRSVNLDGGMMQLSSGLLTFNYMAFVVPSLDVDGNYINKDLITYRIYVNDELYTITPSTYRYVTADMTDIPYDFDEGYDFRSYDQLKYVYLYFEKDQVTSLGVQSVYTVNGEERVSEISTVRFDSTIDPDDPRLNNDLTLTCRLVDNMVKADEKVTLRGTVTNNGKNPAVGFVINYTNNGEKASKTFTDVLSAGKSANFDIEFEAEELSVGESAKVEVEVAFAETTKDENKADNKASLAYGIYNESTAKPMLLLEEFTAESCGWCPFGAWRIETAIKESGLEDRVLWMCHHEGYGVDWLTVPESTTYTELYGGNTFAPAWILDRNQKYSDESFPVFGIPDVADIQNILAEAMKKPCFVDVDVENTCNSGVMSISVKAEKSELFDVQCAEPRITVFVVENNITPKKQKTYDSHTITKHHNALRAVLTDVWGDAINWNGNSAEVNYEFSVPEDYDLENVKVIAFIHEKNSDVNQRRVFNTAVSDLFDITGISNITANNTTSATYNLLGQKVSANTKGIVIKNGKKMLVK